MEQRPTILITNDDGIRSPGLWLMAEELKQWADIFVVAPHEEQSGTSLSITIHRPLTIHRWKEFSLEKAWSVSGTPADCVKAALSLILPKQPDIIVSGINRGSNAGKTVLYSGTVGGAIEAALRGYPAVAFSSYNMDEPAFDRYAPYTSDIVRYAIMSKLYTGMVLNVNFPCPHIAGAFHSHPPIRGFKLTRQGKEYILEQPQLIEAPNAHNDHHLTIFHLGRQLVPNNADNETTDIYWLKQGFATCVPIYVEDLTHTKFLQQEQHQFEKFLQLASSHTALPLE